ncbi:MAG TPA: P27 family phage terminase small subunit [Caulobacteraceae bacterium]|nr:P27 family phage terminase small subunit [Caulobacteraceae bacterium]
MGERGPAPDPDQAAKGFPGKRRSKAEKAALEQVRIAALLSPAVGATADLPALLQDPKYAAAAAVWRRLAPELRRTHRLPLESEFLFAQFCIYAQEWVQVTDDLHTKGFSQNINTVAGGKMERRRPKVFDRQQAFQNCTELSGRFGLTPADMYGLFKDQALVAARNPGLFGDDRKAPAPGQDAPSTEPAPDVGQPSRVGSMAGMRSPAPPSTH